MDDNNPPEEQRKFLNKVGQKDPRDTTDGLLPHGEKGVDGYVEKEHKTYTRGWCGAAYLLIFLNIGFLLATLTVTIVWHVQRKNYLEGGKSESDICLQCAKLSSNWREDKSIFVKFTVKNETCCGKTSNHLDKLVIKNLESKRPFHSYAYTTYGCSSNKQERPAIRVVGIDTVHGENGTLLWKKESSLSYNKSGMFYKDGHLHVTEDGHYYAYSQVVFADETKQLGTLHSMHKRSLNQTRHEKLLEGTHSSCRTHYQQSERTSFVGAVFWFDTGDKIMTKLDQKTRWTKTDHHHHFGMYKIY